MDELSMWRGRLPAERLRVLTAILGDERPGAGAERMLGNRFSRYHLVALARPTTSGHIPEREAELQKVGAEATRVAAMLGQDQKMHDLRESLRHFLKAGSGRLAEAQALHLATDTVALEMAFGVTSAPEPNV
ncbi:MAG: hypothetical protein HIU81_06205 [Acidobacteria bacterium]|nr:hypothetical protein [Acidobacteriota bacterium]